MKTPNIEFRYSGIYDTKYRNSPNILKVLKKSGKKYPSDKEVFSYMKRIREKWKKDEKKILNLVSKITGLKWQEDNIIVYVVGFSRCFSDPLTMRVFDKDDVFIDTLTHELIHRINVRNREAYKRWNDAIKKKYPKESQITLNHILTHAIHKKIILELFNNKRLQREIKSTKDKGYIRAWEIVEKEGYENIIKIFRGEIK